MIANSVIRDITVEDAEAYNVYRRRIADEPENNIGHSAGEYTRTIEQERQILLVALAAPNHQIYVAALENTIIGTCMCRAGSLLAARHVVGMGMDVDREYRHQGIGSALLKKMMDWAWQHPDIRRIELTVFALNRRAINLYLKYGFVIEGLSRDAYFKDGHFIDAYTMALLLRK